MIYVDDASNIKGSDTRITLEGLGDILIEQTLKLEFIANNNQAEYEALIIGMILTFEMWVFRQRAKSDSQLVANQVSRSTKPRSHN